MCSHSIRGSSSTGTSLGGEGGSDLGGGEGGGITKEDRDSEGTNSSTEVISLAGPSNDALALSPLPLASADVSLPKSLASATISSRPACTICAESSSSIAACSLVPGAMRMSFVEASSCSSAEATACCWMSAVASWSGVPAVADSACFNLKCLSMLVREEYILSHPTIGHATCGLITFALLETAPTTVLG